MLTRIKLMESPKDYEHYTKMFMNFCKSKNLSNKTLRFYSNNLKNIFTFFEKQYPTKNVETLTIVECREYVNFALNTYAIQTVKHNIRVMKYFFKFLQEEGVITESPANRIEMVKVPQTIIQTFTDEQVNDLLNACDKTTFSGLRDFTLMLFLLDTGTRISEALYLKIKDINFNDCLIKVLGKGNKERLIPLSHILREQLRKYIRVSKLQNEGYLFPTALSQRLCFTKFDKRLKDYGEKINISDVRCSAHTFRHTFAVNWIRQGGDAFSLQRMLGHSTLDMTKRYVNMNLDDVINKHNMFSFLNTLEIESKYSPKKKEQHTKIKLA